MPGPVSATITDFGRPAQSLLPLAACLLPFACLLALSCAPATPVTPVVSLTGSLPAEAVVGGELRIAAQVTNHGPGAIGDLGLELISFRGPVANFRLLQTAPAARFGWTQNAGQIRIFLFGPLPAGQTAAYVIVVQPAAAGIYPLRVALDDFAGDPLGRPLRERSGRNAWLEGTVTVH